VAVGVEADVVAADVEGRVVGLVDVRRDAVEPAVELLGGGEVLDGYVIVFMPDAIEGSLGSCPCYVDPVQIVSGMTDRNGRR
jgi:hypothetical protein